MELFYIKISHSGQICFVFNKHMTVQSMELARPFTSTRNAKNYWKTCQIPFDEVEFVRVIEIP